MWNWRRNVLRTSLFAVVWSVGVLFGLNKGLTSHVAHASHALVSKVVPAWDNPFGGGWPAGFSKSEIAGQKAYFRAASGAQQRPLLISLHTWSGDYNQADPLAAFAVRQNWNYIHPDAGGVNDHPGACLSDGIIPGLDQTIDYAEKHWRVDPSRIAIVGVSGGGYITLGAYQRLQHPIRAFIAWAPISDLQAWYRQSIARGNDYGKMIIACTSGGAHPDFAAMAARSPLAWPLKQNTAKLEIYAGINDGYTGSVPISQSISFFNKVAGGNPVSTDEAEELLSRGALPTRDQIGGRRVYFKREGGNVRLTIFSGTHEMLTDYTAIRLKDIMAAS